MNKPMPVHMFRAEISVLQISYYINLELYVIWARNLFNRRQNPKTVNKWSKLYEKQGGLCVICEEPLGYLLEETLEIHHVIQVSQASEKDVNRLSNLQLIHKSCHKTIPII